MRVWRLMKRQFIDSCLTGEGARLFGGRWNYKGIPVIYTAEDQALAVLESLVHIDIDLLPEDYLFVPIDIDDKIKIDRLDEKDLPEGWRAVPAPDKLQSIGSRWLRKDEAAILQVPSAVLPYEHNYLINPQHKDIQRIQYGEPEDYSFDSRLIRW